MKLANWISAGQDWPKWGQLFKEDKTIDKVIVFTEVEEEQEEKQAVKKFTQK